jgi:hypothetical protein
LHKKVESQVEYSVALFPSASDALRAEKVIKERGIPAKLIPVPRQLSSDCGVCLRIERQNVEATREALTDAGIRVEGILPLV